MKAIISLKKVLDELEAVSGESSAFLNVNTGETYVVFDEESAGDDKFDDDANLPDWQKQDHRIRREIADGNGWIDLPSSFDIHEWSILEAFALQQSNSKLRETLLDAIHQSGAFRRFKALVARHGIDAQWYRFREDHLKALAIAWLKEHNLKFVDDTQVQAQAQSQSEQP